MPPRELLFVFDFDNTLVHDNTDTRPFHLLAPDLLVSHLHNRDLYKSVGWTALVNIALEHLSHRCVIPSQIIHAASTAPFPPQNVRFINAIAESPHAHSAILSDANTLYIDACLRANQLQPRHFRAGIFTNPASVADNRLRVDPFVPRQTPHDCPRCPPNLCKGLVLRALINEYPHSRVVYAGDGRNDYCPATIVPPDGLVLPRRGYALEKLVPDGIPASVLIWATADDLERIITGLLNSPA